MAKRITSIIGERILASAISKSIAKGLACPNVYLDGGRTVWHVFERSLNTAIRDIETHPRGKLFRRLIQHGPHHPGHPPALTSDGETVLSDPECGEAVEFIFSHMVNRFKGELAELLAVEPCISLFQSSRRRWRVPDGIQLYWAGTVQERRRAGLRGSKGEGLWSKGADGLLVRETPTKAGRAVDVKGIVEVKSMSPGKKKLLEQINRHVVRLNGGVKLGGVEYAPARVTASHPSMIGVMVVPSAWKLSREWRSERGKHGGRRLVFPPPSEPPTPDQLEEIGDHLWRVTLAWSREALEQAAYEMTFWYMSQVGRAVYGNKKMPKAWERFTPQEAGYNAIKMMLYYILLRRLSSRHERLATKLYNIYSFGYPLGVDGKEMLWPEDLTPGGG